jgi:hypothetical protein
LDYLLFEYRKELGLSYKDMMGEPYEEFILNLSIMEAKAKRASREQRAINNLRK